MTGGLPDALVDDWRDPKQEDRDKLKALLVPASDSLLLPTSVSTRVNSVKNDDPDCLMPPDDAPPPAMQRLL